MNGREKEAVTGTLSIVLLPLIKCLHGAEEKKRDERIGQERQNAAR